MNTGRMFLFLSLLLTSLLPAPAAAQRFPFYNLNVEDGLAQSQPRAIVEDSLGQLWIGTLGGLSRYDGKQFVNYSARNGLPGNMVRALAIDTAGQLWVGGSEGLSCYDGRTFRDIPIAAARGKGRAAVRQIAVDERGMIWILASGRLYFIQDDSARLVNLPFQNTAVTTFLPVRNTLFVAAANGMMYQYRQHLWDSTALPALANGSVPLVSQLFEDSKGGVWLGGNMGLMQWQGQGWQQVLPFSDSAYYPVYAITEDKSGRLWLGCGRGVITLSGKGETAYFDKKNGLSNNIFFSVYTDRAGNVWLASDGQGLYRFSGAPFTIVDESTGLGSGQVMSMAEGKEGTVYLGTYDGGLFQYRNGGVQEVKLPVPEVPAITALNYHKGLLWIGTRAAGLWRWDGARLKVFRKNRDGIPSDNIIAFYRDSSGQLWTGTAAGAAFLRQDQWLTIPRINSDIQAFLAWNRDSMLLTGSEGLWWYAHNKVTPFVTGGILDSLPPQTMVRTGDLLWAGTSENGVVIHNLKHKKSFVLNSQNILRSDFIYSMLLDRSGTVWIGTGMGIHSVSGYLTDNTNVRIYGSGESIAGMESNHNAALQTSDGTVWMGTTDGAMLFPLTPAQPLAQNTALILQSVSLPGMTGIPEVYYKQLSAWNQVPLGMELPYRQNTVSFTFQSLAMVQQKQVRYRHRLLGLETAWSPWVAENTITYSALPPGKYTLQVESGILGGHTPVSVMDYSFSIQTPFHKSIWFRILLVLLMILIGITIQYLLSKRKRRMQEMIRELRAEEQNKVRQRTAEDFHDEVGNRITRISVLAQVLKNKFRPLPEDGERILNKIQENATLLYNGTRDILWALKPENDNLYELLQRLNEVGTELFQDTPVAFYFAGASEKWRAYKLPMDVNRNLMMIFKEAMNNCLKYAESNRVNLIASVSEDQLFTLLLEDNGKGFDPSSDGRGQGLNNMMRRAGRIGGRLSIEGHSESGGAAICLELPLAGFVVYPRRAAR